VEAAEEADEARASGDESARAWRALDARPDWQKNVIAGSPSGRSRDALAERTACQ
jgi:hypothetical protein